MSIRNTLLIYCKLGKLDDIKKLSLTNHNIHNNDEEAFRVTCWYGKIEVVKYLIDITIDTDNPIDIHIKNHRATNNW